jgi:hypothetical protein
MRTLRDVNHVSYNHGTKDHLSSRNTRTTHAYDACATCISIRQPTAPTYLHLSQARVLGDCDV